MQTIPAEDFPPRDAIVIERDDGRVVLLHSHPNQISVAVWLRYIESVRPTVYGGWYCSPDAGLSLTRESASILLEALTKVLAR